jgi:hypothetical protein
MLVIPAGVVVIIVVVKLIRLRGDFARVVLERAVVGLPRERQEWGKAMLGELGTIQGRLERTRFALGCARVSVAPPPLPGAQRRSRNAAVAVIACTAALSLYTLVRLIGSAYPDSTSHGPVYEFVLWLVIYAVAAGIAATAVIRTRSRRPDDLAARRYGLIGGVLSGVIALVASLPGLMGPSDSDPFSLVPEWWLFLGAVTIPLVAGLVVAHRTGQARTGLRAGWWAGVTAGAIVVVGLLILTYAATGWFVHDPATITAYHRSWPPLPGVHQTHYRNITAFLLAANLGTTALIGILTLPAAGYVAGAIGGTLGARLPRPGIADAA